MPLVSESERGALAESSERTALAPETARPASTPSLGDSRPLQVAWEMTSACDWKALSPRSAGRTKKGVERFSTSEAFHLIDGVAAMHVPLLALTGGDPLLRPDLFPAIEFASSRSVRASLTLLPTALLHSDVITDLNQSGLMRVAFWLHGSSAALHDAYWSVPGSYRRTLEIISHCQEEELPVQIHTRAGATEFARRGTDD